MLNKIGTTLLKNEKIVKTKKRQQLIATCVSVDETSPLHNTPLITLSMRTLLPFVFDSAQPLLDNGTCSGHAVSLLYSTADSIVFGSADYIGLTMCVTVLNGFHFGPCGRVLFVKH